MPNRHLEALAVTVWYVDIACVCTGECRETTITVILSVRDRFTGIWHGTVFHHRSRNFG